MNVHPSKRAEELVSLGAGIAGAAAGGALGIFAAGPVGALGGAVAGVLVTRGLEMAADFTLRGLSHRERMRVGAGLAFAYARISQYFEEGRTARNDGFFDCDASGRSASDEILEGVLLKCKNEHEEKKARILGNIFANVAFMPDVSPAGANWLLQKAEELTYRQMCMISLIERKDSTGASWGPRDGDPAFEREYQDIEIMLERDSSPEAMEHYREIGEGRSITGLSRTGTFCYTVMGLDGIPEDDLRLLAARFPRAFKA